MASVVLNPRMKFHYFERTWQKDWIKNAKEKMTSLYQRYKTSEDVLASDPGEEDTPKPRFDINAWRFQKVDKREDELTRYLKAAVLVLSAQEDADFDILEWWRGNTKEYPTLARIAVDIFSIPAMSVEPERVFSGYNVP